MSFDDDEDMGDDDDSDLDFDSDLDVDSTNNNSDNNNDGGEVASANDRDQVQHLADVFASLQDSLEDLRLTRLFLIEDGGDNDADTATASSTSAQAEITAAEAEADEGQDHRGGEDVGEQPEGAPGEAPVTGRFCSHKANGIGRAARLGQPGRGPIWQRSAQSGDGLPDSQG